MAYEIIWSDTAAADLESIVTYIAEKSAAAAEKTGAAIVRQIEVLRTFPQIGPRYAKDPAGRVRELLCGSYRIFYRPNEQSNSVEVLTIWHGARQEPEIPF